MLIYSSPYVGTARTGFVVCNQEALDSDSVTLHVWKQKHDDQGFLWHRGYVSFVLSVGFESFALEVYLLSEMDPFRPRDDALRSFRIPFQVDKTGYVYVEYSGDYFQLDPGNYTLFCEMGFEGIDYYYGEGEYYSPENPLPKVRNSWVRLTFIPQETVEPEVLVNLPCPPFNEVLTPQYPLLMEEEPDPNAVTGRD